MNPALPKSIDAEVKKGWHYVYMLGSRTTKWIYIGCTSNLEKRLIEHQEGKVFSTKKMLPIELIYFEGYRRKNHAYERERNLKHYGSALSKLKTRIG